MSKIWRALFISAMATGVAAVVLKFFEPTPPAPPAPAREDNPVVDADRLTEEEQALLMQELEGQM